MPFFLRVPRAPGQHDYELDPVLSCLRRKMSENAADRSVLIGDDDYRDPRNAQASVLVNRFQANDFEAPHTRWKLEYRRVADPFSDECQPDWRRHAHMAFLELD